MSTKPTHQIRIGIFLTIGIFAIFTSILLLGGDRAFLKKHAHLYAELTQAQGLDKGSIVSLSGIVIGNVNTITFSAEKKLLIVDMKIQDDYLHLLTKGSVADVRTQGALGDKFIFVTPGDTTSTPLSDGDTIETAKSNDLLGIISEKGGEAVKIFDIINEVYRLTKIINADGRSEKLMVNFVDTSQNLKAMAEDAKKMMAELRQQSPTKLKDSIEHLNNVLAKLDRGEGTLGALINDPTLHERLKAILGADAHKQSIQSLIRTSIEKSEK